MKTALHTIRLLPVLLLCLAVLSSPALAAGPEGAEEDPAESFTELSTYEDLLRMAENPAGRYRLTDSIDMAGRPWQPLDFTGVFDGGGHALLNVTVDSLGAGTEQTYDGNYKVYDTRFAGFFGSLKGAEVSGLRLVNLRVLVETDEPCFIGGIAGYTENSTIRSCAVQGRLELSAHDRMFGVGGIVGYGSGRIEDTSADVTLICTDTDAQTRDEQFMGGAYAAGYLDLKDCDIVIDGYDSDHGYVHNGGLVGMYIFYPAGLQYEGTITGCTASGQITFFEDNTNRRAYCKGFIGEIMNWDFVNSGNHTKDFVRNEVFTYTVNLRPDPCTGATYTQTVTEPGCDTLGYTTVQCGQCGYTYTDHYTLYRHAFADWTVIKEPTVEETGLREGTCTLCGAVTREEIAKLTPPPVTEPVETPPESAGEDAPEGELPPQEKPGGETGVFPVPLLIGALLLLLLLAAAIWSAVRKRGRHL